ncbi:MAG: carbon-nitrogen family hydrolase [Eubacterium sp.]|nr:carbon-nitrogen family hydrolase [Eubacterium sp.]
MKVGLAQMDIVWEDIEKNKEKAEVFFARAAQKQVDLLIFPEMSLTAFSMNVEKTASDWQDQPEFFCQMTRRYPTAAVFGYPRKCGDIYENHLALADHGEIKLDYAKIHPFSYGTEAKYFRGGTEIKETAFMDTVVSGFVCYDLRFPEIFQIASRRSELICLIANWPRTRIGHWDILLQARAIENQCYILAVNRTGEGGKLSYNGHSAIYGPTGERITPVREDEILLTADIDPENVRKYRKEFPLKADRRESLYLKIIKGDNHNHERDQEPVIVRKDSASHLSH